MRKIAGIFLAIAFAGGMAHAQIPTSGDIFVGYSFSRENAAVGTPPTVNLNGWEGSLEGKFLPWIGIVADFGAGYGSTTEAVPAVPCPIPCRSNHINVRRYTYLFGPRVSIPIGKFTPFAHALFGAGHIDDGGITDTSFATAIGGGLDYKLIKGVAWRVQADDVHTRFFGGGQDHLRFSTGIDFRF